jgi:hypothetical protein
MARSVHFIKIKTEGTRTMKYDLQLKKSRMDIRGVGDAPRACGHPSYYIRLDSEMEAQRIADRVAEHFEWPKKWNVFFSYHETKRLRGTANRQTRRIELRKIGQYLGVLLHELAHEIRDPRGPHGPSFQHLQTEILKFAESEGWCNVDSLPKVEAPKTRTVPVWVPTVGDVEMEVPVADEPKVEEPVVEDEPYEPTEDEVDDILEMVVEDLVAAAQAGRVSAKFMYRLLKEFGVASGPNAALVKSLVRDAGIQVVLI